MNNERPLPRLLRLPEVVQITGLSRSSVYKLVAAGEFPAPLKVTAYASAWREDELRTWIESRPTATGHQVAA